MTPNWLGTRFGDDGRRTIAPLLGSGFSYGSESIVRVAVAQQTIINFHRKGYIKLYDKENPVWVVLEYCKVKNVRYHIRNKRIYLNKHQGENHEHSHI